MIEVLIYYIFHANFFIEQSFGNILIVSTVTESDRCHYVNLVKTSEPRYYCS